MARRRLQTSNVAPAAPSRFGLSRWEVSALVTALVVATLPSVMPAMVGALANQLHLAIRDAGYAASANMAGIFVGTLVFGAVGRSFRLRRLLVSGLVVMVAGHLMSIASGAYGPLVATRIVSGLGEGVAGGVTYLLMAASAQPARMLALYLAGQSIIGAAGLAVLPSLSQQFGWRCFFVIVSLAALPAIGLAAVTSWPEPVRQTLRHDGAPPAPFRWRGPLMLGAIFVFFVGMSAVWAMMERLGAQHGLSLLGVSAAMSSSSVLGLVGALTAGAAGRRLPDGLAMSVCALLALAGCGLLVPRSPAAFTAGVCVLNFAWAFTFPFLFRLLVEAGAGGRIAGLTGAATGAALAAGPALGGVVLQSAGQAQLYGLCAALTVSAIATAYLVRRSATADARRTPLATAALNARCA